MHFLRKIFDLDLAKRKLNSRLRCFSQISRSEWPVISATRPLFYLFRIFGLVPFEISEDRFIPRIHDAIYSYFCIIVHTYVIYMVLNKPIVERESIFLGIAETGRVILNHCIAILNILIEVWARKKFIGVLNIVKDFDYRIRDLGYSRNERATVIWAWSTCVWITFLWTAISRLGMIAFSEPWLKNVFYLLNYVSVSLSTIKFSSVVFMLGQRFKHLNKIAQYAVSRESSTTNRTRIAVDFQIIQQLHNSLMNAGESLSFQYAWPLLLWLINLCFHCVSNIYFLIDWIMTTPGWARSGWLLISCLSSWLVNYIIQLLLLHISCHFTSSEANSMGSIIINLKSFAVSRNYNLDSSLHLIIRRLNFSAAGHFYVNMPLLRSITALLSTYLVILFQFHR